MFFLGKIAPVLLLVSVPTFADTQCKSPSSSPEAGLNCDEITPALCSALGPTQSEVREIIFKLLKANTHELKRDVVLYHYGESPVHKSEPEDLKGELASRFFYDKSSGNDFFNPDPRHGYQLYMANNPVVSLDYATIAGSHGLLLRLKIPAGVRFLEDGMLGPISAQEDALIRCYFGWDSPDVEKYGHKFGYRQLKESPKGLEMLKSIFKELKIQLLADDFRDNQLFPECAGESPEVKVIDPSLASMIEISVISPVLESHPSAEKLAAYKEILSYFDAVDVHTILNGGEGDRGKNFVEYYKAWAPIVYSLPPGADAMKFQRDQFKKVKASRAVLVDGMFGCSKNPKYKDEIQ